MQVILF